MCAVNLTYPGVYVEEVSSLAPSVAEVESAIPAFIGYTQQAIGAAGSLTNVPTKISSYAEYTLFFGGPPIESADSVILKATDDGSGGYTITAAADPSKQSKNVLANAIRHFYDNGGGDCYIVSVGATPDDPDTTELVNGINLVEQIDEVTLLAAPESQSAGTYSSVAQAMLNQAAKLGDRFALIDPDSITAKSISPLTSAITTDTDLIKTAASASGKDLSYGAAYYPNLTTTYPLNVDVSTLKFATDSSSLPGVAVNTYPTSSAVYKRVEAAIESCYGYLPPSAAVAGLIAKVDSTKGVWKAPANESLSSVTSPTVLLSDAQQGNLNIDSTSGKSINVIRSFPGYGTTVWGARTLFGNDNEWRYINVRRFFMVVEESIKKSIHWAVFEPNTAATWVKVQAMIENYLFQKWRDGALAGAKPDQAYQVHVGLNKTMTSVDILEGRMIVEILMAVARPAEFIVLRFEQIMQTS